MKTREEALAYGMSFPNTYQEAPFHDLNWQLVRVKHILSGGMFGEARINR